MSHVRRDYGMVLAWAAGTLAVDQAAKWAVSRWLGPGESVGVAGRLIRLTHVTNPGAAFGLFQGRQELFVAATLLVFVLAVVMAGRVGPKSGLALAGLGLAAGGAAGNLVDRLRTGSVIDFIDLSVWPVFNLADTGIVVGVALLFWYLVRHHAPAVSAEGDSRSRS